AKKAFELRHAGAERQLIAVLLLELQRDVDLVLLSWRLLDLGIVGRILFERPEVAELIDSLEAVFQPLAVEDAVLEQPELAADHVVAGRRVADEGDAVDEILLALLQPHRDIDD